MVSKGLITFGYLPFLFKNTFIKDGGTMLNRELYAHLNKRQGYGHSAEKSVLDITQYDANKFNVVADKYNELQNFIHQNSHIPNFNHLVGDIFNSLHKIKPSLKSKVMEEDGIEFKGLDQLKVNEQFIERVMNQEDYERFNQKCRLDETLSLIGTKNYSETVLNWLKENADEDLRNALEGNAPMPMPNNQGSDGQGGQENGDSAGQDQENGQGDGQGQGNGQGQNEGSDQLDPQQQAMLNAIDKLLNEAKNNEEMQNSLQAQLASAKEEAEDLNDKVQNIFGKGSGNDSASYDEIPLADKIELAEMLRNTDSARDIADWCGRFSFYARKKQKNKKAKTTVRSGITIGSEMELITPMELLYLDDEDFELDVLKRIAEGKFQNYSVQNRGQKGKGSLIICLDESGSMRGLERQAKGFVLALMTIARKQKRDVVYIPFSYGVGRVRKFEKGNFKAKDLLEMATNFMNGGTDFESPLEVAQEVIATDITDGDIIFVTDGQDSLSHDFRNSFLKTKKKMDFNMFSLILCGEKEKARYEEVIEQIEEHKASMKGSMDIEVVEEAKRQIESLYYRYPLIPLSDKLETVSDLTDEKSYQAFEI